jgi:hypothetical protein
MKRALAIALVAVLTLGVSPLISNAAVKAGATCKKLGQVSKKAGKEYTCIKKGKKLVWSKGVTIKAAAPAVTPASTPTPTPTLTSNPTPSPTPSPSATAVPTPTPTPQVVLPRELTPCTQIGVKVFGNGGYMKCIWMGGPQGEIAKQIYWRFFDTPTISTSQSNNYAVTPVEGAPCTTSGDSYDVPGGILECRWIAGKKLQWFKINTVKTTFTNAKSLVPLDMCKLQMSASKADRTGRNAGAGQVGFPMVNTTKNGMDPKGINNVLIVPIDFPDFQGTGSPKQQLEYDTKWMLDWYSYFSNGQAKFNVTTIDKWFRMSKPRSGYQTDGKTTSSLLVNANAINGQQAQAFIDEITKEIDLRKFSTVYTYYPDGEYLHGDLIVRNHKFTIKEGEKNLNFFSWGKNLEAGENLKWVYFIHETLHDYNIIGHAPGNGWPFGIMTNNTGISYAINAWEQFVLDWLPEDQIYCDDINTLKTTTVSLSPMEREDKQTKMAIIKVSPTKAVVVEAHGIDKWSSFNTGDRSFPPGFYSVMAYVVDLDKAAAPPNNPDGTALSNQNHAWAVWARTVGGKSTQYPFINISWGEDIYAATAVLGDMFEVEGVRIKFVGTGDYETIEISKA